MLLKYYLLTCFIQYKYPDYFYWPFFFTLQTNGEVRRKQIHMWIDLVLKFCQDNKVWKLTPELFSINLGQNPKINRKLDSKDIEIIFQSLVSVKKERKDRLLIKIIILKIME